MIMNYEPILKKLEYWKNYDGTGDEYRREHDLDCILTGGNLKADTLFSLWLPLRYSLNYFDSPQWIYWKEKEYKANSLSKDRITIKNDNDFINALESDIEIFLPPHHDLTHKLIRLFELGQTRYNVIILPERSMNSLRGMPPYYDYLPHFLYDLLDTDDLSYKNAVIKWIKREYLTILFKGGVVCKENLLDLAGTGSVCSHSPTKISTPFLIENYIDLLYQRKALLLSAA